MTRKLAWTCFAAATLAATLAAGPADAQVRDGGRGPGMGARAGGPAPGGRNFTAGPRAGFSGAGVQRFGAGAGIEPRIRTGAVDLRRDRYVSAGGARPLTIARNQTYVSQGRYRPGGAYYYRDRNRGWFPGALAAPFLLPGALLGAGYGYGYDYDDGYYPYGGDYYYGPTYAAPVGYPGPVSYGGAIGNYCATPQKTCQLYTPAEVGLGCSCRAPAGLPPFRGAVVP